MEGQLGLSELSTISWVSAVEGCSLNGVPLYTVSVLVCVCTLMCDVCSFVSMPQLSSLVVWNVLRGPRDSSHVVCCKCSLVLRPSPSFPSLAVR